MQSRATCSAPCGVAPTRASGRCAGSVHACLLRRCVLRAFSRAHARLRVRLCVHVRCRHACPRQRLLCLRQRAPARLLLLAQCLRAPARGGRHRRIVRVDALLFLERPALGYLGLRHAALARTRRLQVRLRHAELPERLLGRGLVRPPRALVRVHSCWRYLQSAQ